MKIEIIAPCFYPSVDAPHLKYFLKSAMRHGLMPYKYGLGRSFGTWIDTHITACLIVLRQLDSSHILFTDASDVIFLNGMHEIKRRYVRLGHPPMLVSEEETGMNAGGWLGERMVAIEILDYLSKQGGSGDPQERWRKAIREQQVHVVHDRTSVIFQVSSNTQPVDTTCLLHFAGGYTDPIVGKQELIEPFWGALGYEF